MRLKHFLFGSLWLLAMVLSWRAGSWRNQAQQEIPGAGKHAAMFHMHRPLHPGGKVNMVGQYHLELASLADGTHRLWISDAERQELDPAGFEGVLSIYREGEEALTASFEREGRGKGLLARSTPMSGQVWLKVSGVLGPNLSFEDVAWFWDYEPRPADLAVPLGLDHMIPRPKDNLSSPARVELGRDLFFDPALSADGTLSCASCHRPEHAFASPEVLANGVEGRSGRRNTPTVLNTVYQRELFWDGRSPSLEKQALEPILDHAEMGIASIEDLVERLEPRYGARMSAAYDEGLSARSIAKAIACYERTLLSGDSDFDRYEAGQEEAISSDARTGRGLFFGRVGCGNCHTPPLFTDLGYHNLGVGLSGGEDDDLGRYELSRRPQDRGAFKTPSLRDVSRTAPYMHDGSIATLAEVIEFYDRGCVPNDALDPLVKPLGLTSQESGQLLAFLETLDGRTPPELSESTEARGGRR